LHACCHGTRPWMLRCPVTAIWSARDSLRRHPPAVALCGEAGCVRCGQRIQARPSAISQGHRLALLVALTAETEHCTPSRFRCGCSRGGGGGNPPSNCSALKGVRRQGMRVRCGYRSSSTQGCVLSRPPPPPPPPPPTPPHPPPPHSNPRVPQTQGRGVPTTEAVVLVRNCGGLARGGRGGGGRGQCGCGGSAGGRPGQRHFPLLPHVCRLTGEALRGRVALWLCGSVALWLCGSVALWLCGSVALWLCGSVALWLCVCRSIAVAVAVGVRPPLLRSRTEPGFPCNAGRAPCVPPNLPSPFCCWTCGSRRTLRGATCWGPSTCPPGSLAATP
jgi:hypothetical protein